MHIFVSTLIFASPFIFLLFMMPGQYEFVVEHTLDNPKIAMVSLGLSAFYGICIRNLYEKVESFDWRLVLPFIPALLIIITFQQHSGLSPTLLFLSLGTVVLAVCFQVLLPLFRPQITVAVLSIVLIVFALFAVSHWYSPIHFSREVGAVSIVVVFFGTIATLAMIALKTRKRALWVLSALGLGILLSGSNDHRIPLTKSSDLTPNIVGSLDAWLKARKDLAEFREAGLPYPVILVSSEGGGIYAAAHAYLTLSVLQQRCPVFTQHIFAAIGVSGGALGNALFGASVPNKQNAYKSCTPGNTDVDISSITDDHLSPVLARLLLLETVDRIIPGGWFDDRGIVLAASFLASSRDQEYLRATTLEGWKPTDARPALAPVATNRNDGKRLIMAPFVADIAESQAYWWRVGGEPFGDPSVIDAAATSARFPWLTPTAVFPNTNETGFALADGGYFENSGADTVMSIIEEIEVWKKNSDFDEASADTEEGLERKCNLIIQRNFHNKARWQGCDKHVFFIHLAITTSEIEPHHLTVEPVGSISQNFLLDPFRVFLNTRTSRGELALARAKEKLCGTAPEVCISAPGASVGFLQNQLSAEELGLSLGWHLSKKHAKAILAEVITSEHFNYREVDWTQRDPADLDDMLILITHLDIAFNTE